MVKFGWTVLVLGYKIGDNFFFFYWRGMDFGIGMGGLVLLLLLGKGCFYY